MMRKRIRKTHEKKVKKNQGKIREKIEKNSGTTLEKNQEKN